MEQHTIICRTCCVGGCTFSTSITFSRDEMDMFLEGLKLIQIFVFVLGILKKILRYMRVRTRGITKGAIPSSFLPPLDYQDEKATKESQFIDMHVGQSQ
ncbi:uncharacterized protein LOC126881511 isoform X3 [Diabrotica virgifera virgifera]|uniref:Uncharacterized protein n=1 Tax=Diabrotica virgifera virgifera TaxID=50390 RepID=A0ABM5JV22_DIAVI|nr:uncharacterized protein LOC126881511 isoform X3 [Diabrotica virgifera virgifera]